MNTEGHWFGLLRSLWILKADGLMLKFLIVIGYGLCILSQIKSKSLLDYEFGACAVLFLSPTFIQCADFNSQPEGYL